MKEAQGYETPCLSSYRDLRFLKMPVFRRTGGWPRTRDRPPHRGFDIAYLLVRPQYIAKLSEAAREQIDNS